MQYLLGGQGLGLPWCSMGVRCARIRIRIRNVIAIRIRISARARIRTRRGFVYSLAHIIQPQRQLPASVAVYIRK